MVLHLFGEVPADRTRHDGGDVRGASQVIERPAHPPRRESEGQLVILDRPLAYADAELEQLTADAFREGLAQAYRRGELSVLDEGRLFDRALESVIGNLREMRTRGS